MKNVVVMYLNILNFIFYCDLCDMTGITLWPFSFSRLEFTHKCEKYIRLKMNLKTFLFLLIAFQKKKSGLKISLYFILMCACTLNEEKVVLYAGFLIVFKNDPLTIVFLFSFWIVFRNYRFVFGKNDRF